MIKELLPGLQSHLDQHHTANRRAKIETTNAYELFLASPLLFGGLSDPQKVGDEIEPITACAVGAPIVIRVFLNGSRPIKKHRIFCDGPEVAQCLVNTVSLIRFQHRFACGKNGLHCLLEGWLEMILSLPFSCCIIAPGINCRIISSRWDLPRCFIHGQWH